MPVAFCKIPITSQEQNLTYGFHFQTKFALKNTSVYESREGTDISSFKISEFRQSFQIQNTVPNSKFFEFKNSEFKIV